MKLLKEFIFDNVVSAICAICVPLFFILFLRSSYLVSLLSGFVAFILSRLFAPKLASTSFMYCLDILKCYWQQSSHSMPWVKVTNIDITLKKRGNEYLYIRTIKLSPILKPMMHYVQLINAMGRKVDFESITCSTADIEFHKVLYDTQTLGEFQVLKFVMSRSLQPKESASITIALKVTAHDFVPLLGVHVDNHIAGEANLSVDLDYIPDAFIIEQINGGQIAQLLEYKNKSKSSKYAHTFANLSPKNRYRIRWG